MKYITFDDDTFVIFPDQIEHAFMASKFKQKPISAGFVNIVEGRKRDHSLFRLDGTEVTRLVVSGRSTSLNLNSSFERDNRILNRAFAY